ncbi:MAG TPA: alpha/beta hydrolase, partial [Cyanobacteria bacterium UBA12227]|nr:alpha/beta hydrolase [Cyanobacteria bacterium UBA12227]
MITQAIPSVRSIPKPGTYWHWRGQSIYYVRAGERQSGRSPLLLIHGFGASTDHWRKNIAELQN